MNATELASAMDSHAKQWKGRPEFRQAATMLRQQQAEIEALKDEVAMWKMSYENNIRMEDGYGLN